MVTQARRRLTLRLELFDEFQTHGEVLVDLDDSVAFMGERFAEDTRAKPWGLGQRLEGLVRVLRVKEFRRKGLIVFAQKLGEALAHQLEDREGWHGYDRQEKVEKALSRQLTLYDPRTATQERKGRHGR